MKTKTIIGANSAYFCIQTEYTSLDIMLHHGKPVKSSLEETEQELRDKADKLIKRAELIRMAINTLPA